MPNARTQRFYYKQNRVKQLRAFCYAVQTSSITGAAQQMHLSQPTLSLLIRSLEHDLDTQLFYRKGPRIEVTPDGRILADLAQPIIDSVESLVDTFNEHRNNVVAGELDVVAGEGTIQYILPKLVKEFCDAYRDVQIKLRNAAGGELLGYLRRQEMDLGFGSLVKVPDDVSYEPLLHFRPTLITSCDHPLAKLDDISLEDISHYGLIVPPRDINAWRIIDSEFRRRGLEYRVAMEISGWEVIKAFVRRGLGISIVSEVCLNDSTDLVCRPMAQYFPPRSYGLINIRGRHLSLAARRFMEFSRQWAQRNA